MRLTTGKGNLYLDDMPFFLRSGEMHYFRIKPEYWATSLARVKEAALNTISTYVPWIWHEPVEGQFDWTGDSHPQRDLIGFVQRVQEAGLNLIIRPGPFIYAEYPGLGIPLWVGEHYPETVVRLANGKLDRDVYYYNHAVMHPAFLSLVDKWYRALAQAVRPFCNHPILALQLDNETGSMYANRVGKIDFNPDTIERFRQFLRRRYSNVAELNRAWHSQFANFSMIEPPRPPFGQARAIDWQCFLENWLVQYLAELQQLVTKLDLDLQLSLNDSAAFLSPANPFLKARLVDIHGYDTYVKFTAQDYPADLPFASSQDPATFQAYVSDSKPLIALESQCGWFDPRGTVSHASTVQSLLAGVAHGVKGINLYTVQNGHNPDGSSYAFQAMLDAEAQMLPRYQVVSKIERLIADHEQTLLASHEIHDPIGFASYYPSRRLIPPAFVLRQALNNPAWFAALLGQAGWHGLLLTAGYTPRFFDLESISQSELDQFKVIIFPCYGSCDQSSYRKLLAYVEEGGHLLTMPMIALRDTAGAPLPTQDLYPFRPMAEHWIDRGRIWVQVLLWWALKYYLSTRRETSRRALTTLHILDSISPAMALLQTPWKGLPVDTQAGYSVRGDFYWTEFELGATGHDSEALLHHRGKTLAYRTRVKEGSSTVIGTCLAGRYATPRYYDFANDERTRLRQYVIHLMSELGIERSFETNLEVEIVARQVEGGCWLFLINRTLRQTGSVRLVSSARLGLKRLPIELQTIYRFKNSHAELHADTLDVELEPYDVVVLRLS